MKNKAMQARLTEEIVGFLRSRRSLQLASLGEDGVPFASYAPYAIDANSFYVLLSDIASHGLNLRREPRASVLVIEDEDSAGELFARVRVSYEIRAEELAVGTAEWQQALEELVQRHGERPRNLSQLSDFRLFRLRPVKGRYVKGFGKAYSLGGDTLGAERVDHLREGHKPRSTAVI
ncbi:MAG: pyridoxamine 5'-phosphate oxidase family protein [Pseudomonadota bacterium]